MTSILLLMLQDLTVTIVSGTILAVAFFWIREVCFPLPAIEGRWYVEARTARSSFNPYKDMILQYETMLWREGTAIKGTAEKIFENSEKKQGEYVGDKRTRSQIGGYIEKRYFGPDRVCLHVVEQGRQRESTTFFKLTYRKGKCVMTGEFDSMAGTSSGKAHVRRERRPLHFQPKYG